MKLINEKKTGFLLIGFFWLTVCVGLLLPSRAYAAFGLTSSGGYYTVDTGAGLVFKVSQANGSITSIKYNANELQDQSKFSHIASGFGGIYSGATVSVTGTTYSTNYIKVTVNVTTGTKTLTHYYMARNGYNDIYMATFMTAEPDIGELRYIARLQQSKLPYCPAPSNIRGNTGAIESADVFGMANGHTRSKYYGRERAIDLTYRGVTGPGVGVFMIYDNRESSSGGPFYLDIMNQTGEQQELYNYMNSGHEQTEAYRTNVLYGPYVYAVTDGSAPAMPVDTSWIRNLGLTGWIQHRGYVVGKASGIPGGFQGVVGFANATAQYWCKIDPATGNFTSPWMKPGDYTMTLYKGELAVATDTVTVPQSTVPVAKDIASTEITRNHRWRLGEWDGTPAGFLNADKILDMHPSDVRMSSWGPVTHTVESSPWSSFPMAQWKDVNNPTTIKFNLASNQLTAHTLRIGLTVAFAGGRPQVSVNSWTSSIPASSSQPDSRSLTLGTYRGNNVTYTYNIPASAFVAGTNTMTLTVVSGTSGTSFLSPGYAYDCVELEAPLNGTYRITPQHAQDKAMNVAGANPANGTQIDIYAFNGGLNQQFLLDPQSDGTYRIRTALAGNRCVELPFGDASDGTLIKLWDDNGNNAQRWNIVPVIGEWHKIVPKNDATKCMDVFGGPGGTADGTIVNSWTYFGASNQLWRFTDIPAPTLSINDVAVTEDPAQGAPAGTTNVVFTVTLPVASTQTITVDYATADGTVDPANAGSDYTAGSGTLTFNPGDMTKSVTIPVTGDALDENNETFFVNLSNATNATINKSLALGTITDNDPTAVLTINDFNFTESTGPTTNASFTVTLAPVSGRTVLVNYTTADGTAKQPGDYSPRSGTLTFLPGQTTKTLTIGVKGDAIDEDDEFFKINLSGAVGGNIGKNQGVCTIIDNDTSMASINNVTIVENDSGPKNMKFTVSLSNPNSRNVTVDYATADNTAKAGSDYVAASGTVIFNPGQTLKTFIVQTTGDLLDENNETYLTNLSNPTNALISDAQGLGTLNDDDPAPSLSINDINGLEGKIDTTDAVFIVTLSEVSERDVSVKYVTVNGSAVMGSDYIAVTGTLIIPAGQISGTISVPMIGDEEIEGDETFKVNLSGAVAANLADNQGICIITNDDVSG